MSLSCFLPPPHSLQLVSRAAAQFQSEGKVPSQKSAAASASMVRALSEGDDVGEGDVEEEDEEEEGEEDEAAAMTPAQIRAKALFLLVAGVGLVTFFR